MPVFTEQERQEFATLQTRYGAPQASVLPVLWRIQEKMGWIDDDAMGEAAEICQVPKSHIQGVVTFYTMFFDKPMGRFHVQVCTNVSCMLLGGEKLYDSVKSKLGIPNHGRTEDGMFSLEECECMGACGGAPIMAINERFYEKISVDEATTIIDSVGASGTLPTPKFFSQMPELSEAANR